MELDIVVPITGMVSPDCCGEELSSVKVDNGEGGRSSKLAEEREEHLVLFNIFIFDSSNDLWADLQILQVRISLTLEEAAEDAGNARNYLKRGMMVIISNHQESVIGYHQHVNISYSWDNVIITWQKLRMGLRPQQSITRMQKT